MEEVGAGEEEWHCETQGPLPRVAPRRGPFLSMSRRDAALEGQ